QLAGKVVLVDFWAYSCINCQRAIPHVEAWYSKYKDDGLVVVGVHTPEYAFEHDRSNVEDGAKRLGITYPVALDNDYGTWDNYGNSSWPAEYLVDAQGQVRHVAIGEGDYAGTEQLIRRLLTDAHPGAKLPGSTDVPDTTPEHQVSPETYLGSARAQYYAGPQALKKGTRTFTFAKLHPGNAEFGLAGTWTVTPEELTSGPGAQLRLNFLAKKVYLDVGGTGTVSVTVDGRTTSYDVHGAPNIYTVYDGSLDIKPMVLRLSPGLEAYSFTFG
ncbi:MAG: redoxin domain-containing protein, partial [Marmoricola sp.]